MKIAIDYAVEHAFCCRYQYEVLFNILYTYCNGSLSYTTQFMFEYTILPALLKAATLYYKRIVHIFYGFFLRKAFNLLQVFEFFCI